MCGSVAAYEAATGMLLWGEWGVDRPSLSNNDAKEYGSGWRVALAVKLAEHCHKPSCGGLDGKGNTPAVAPDQRYPNDICRLY